MRKNEWLPIDSPWFINLAVPIIIAGLGLPLSVALLLESGGDWGKIAVAAIPVLFCGITGYLLIRIIFWFAPASEEEQGAE